MEPRLSDRESEILELVVLGRSNKEIAAELFISSNTVRVHLTNIFQKLGVSSRTEAVHVAKELGLLAETTSPNADGHQQPIEPINKPVASIQKSSMAKMTALFLALGMLIVVAAFLLITRQANPFDPVPDLVFEILPVPQLGRLNPSLNVIDGKLVISSGMVNKNVVGSAEALDEKSKVWSLFMEKPTAVQGGRAIILDGKVCFPGGAGADDKPLNILEVYDLETKSWAKASPLPMALSNYALANYEGLLYLIGGWDGTAEANEILRYDPNTDKWSTAGNLPEPRRNADAAIFGDRIVIAGGTTNGAPQDNVLAFRPQRTGHEIELLSMANLPFQCPQCNLENMGDILFAISPEAVWQYVPTEEDWLLTGKVKSEVAFDSVTTTSSNGYLYIWGTNEKGFSLLKTQLVYTLAMPGILK